MPFSGRKTRLKPRCELTHSQPRPHEVSLGWERAIAAPSAEINLKD
jgi:hypothetical protein